jgi:hypothetical protein
MLEGAGSLREGANTLTAFLFYHCFEKRRTRGRRFARFFDWSRNQNENPAIFDKIKRDAR